VTVLLDTHFLLWIVTGAERLGAFPWLDRYRPWGISPVSLLEIQFLAEVGRLSVEQPAFAEAVRRDSRFVVDEVALVALVDKALALSWTRDPFDRLLAAHSEARRVSFCSLDRRVRARHRLLVEELR
jgi:PIN domain nuclease of toxin-antitoxin system